MDLPTLDFSLYYRGSEEARFSLAVALVKSFVDHGFVKLINHGIPEETVKNYLAGVSDEAIADGPNTADNDLSIVQRTFQLAIPSESKNRERQRPTSAARMEH